MIKKISITFFLFVFFATFFLSNRAYAQDKLIKTCITKKIDKTAILFKDKLKCSEKALKGKLGDEAGCFDESQEDFFTRWLSVEEKSVKKKENCTATVSMEIINEFLSKSIETIITEIKTGLGTDKKDRKARAKLANAVANKGYSLLKAESNFLNNNNTGRLERVKARAQRKFDKKWNRALKKLSGSEPSKEVIENEIDKLVKTVVESIKVIPERKGIVLELTWAKSVRDIDAHLWGPEQIPFHVNHQNLGSKEVCPFAVLNRDIIDSIGVEAIVIDTILPGTYLYAVNAPNENLNNPGKVPDITKSKAKVTLFLPGETTPQRFKVPTSGKGDWWTLLEINVDNEGNPQINVMGNGIIGTADPSPYTDENATGCEGVLTGRVVDKSTGTIVSEAVVRVLQDDTEIQTVQTDSNGEFIIGGLASENYTLDITVDGFLTVLQTVVVAPPGITDIGDIELTPTFVTGKVVDFIPGSVDSDDASAISGAEVRALRDGEEINTVLTDEEGIFTFTGLPGGTYRFEAHKEGYLFGEVTDIEVPPHNDTDAGIIMLSLTAVTGTIREIDGPAIQDATVKVFSGDQEIGAAITNQDGFFSLLGLPGGVHRFEVSADGYLVNELENVVVPPHDNLDLGTIPLTPTIVTGQVIRTGEGSVPVPDAVVVVLKDSELVAETDTDQNGVYTFRRLPGDTYIFQASILIPQDDGEILFQGMVEKEVLLHENTDVPDIELIINLMI